MPSSRGDYVSACCFMLAHVKQQEVTGNSKLARIGVRRKRAIQTRRDAKRVLAPLGRLVLEMGGRVLDPKLINRARLCSPRMKVSQ